MEGSFWEYLWLRFTGMQDDFLKNDTPTKRGKGKLPQSLFTAYWHKMKNYEIILQSSFRQVSDQKTKWSELYLLMKQYYYLKDSNSLYLNCNQHRNVDGYLEQKITSQKCGQQWDRNGIRRGCSRISFYTQMLRNSKPTAAACLCFGH